MDPIQYYILQSRRSFLTTFANGVGMVALASLLNQDGLLAAPQIPNPKSQISNPSTSVYR